MKRAWIWLVMIFLIAGCSNTGTPPTSSSANIWNERQPSISANGKLAYASDEDNPRGKYDLWLADLTTGEKRRLTSYGDIQYPCISPQGDVVVLSREGEVYLYYIARNSWKKIGRGLRCQWDLSGSLIVDESLTITEVESGRKWQMQVEPAVNDTVVSAGWYPDGQGLIISYRHQGVFRLEVGRLSNQEIIRAEAQRLLPKETRGTFGASAVHPQEKAVAFLAGGSDGYRRIYTTPARGGECYLYDTQDNMGMPEDEASGESEYTLCWSSDGQLLYFHKINSATGRKAIYTLQVSGATKLVRPGVKAGG